jgi:hypothetical protein
MIAVDFLFFFSTFLNDFFWALEINGLKRY